MPPATRPANPSADARIATGNRTIILQVNIDVQWPGGTTRTASITANPFTPGQSEADAEKGLDRIALKLATGAGKTTVMAMLIAWQTVNAVRSPNGRRFTRGFLIVTPGLTIRDRLRVLLPNDPDSYYKGRELVPNDMLGDLGRAQIVITNYHAFRRRETVELAAGNRALLQGRGPDLQTTESAGQMLQRVMPGLMGLKGVMVLNDEAHHCYREKPVDESLDVLVACAFNDEALASEFNQLGRIPVLKARMNAELHRGTQLKNTGKGNSFVIFGEPDIDVLPPEDAPAGADVTDYDVVRVKINGVDVFHPQTGEVRSDGAEGIACWFIDTDYNDESFFVRHTYFLGASDPYKGLRTTLKVEINAEAWATLNSDTSRPFKKPAGGKIAVKVINHLGDEVMKVFAVK